MTKLLFVFSFLALTLHGHAQVAPARQKLYNLDNGLAIKGYDPVAYFSEGKPLKGSKDFATTYQGVTYYFTTAANREKFRAAPASYEPQYGGWCAYAMGNDGSRVDVDPETFKLIDGKLFLFYNRFFNNTLKTWNKNEAGLHQKADENWKKFSAGH